MNDLELSVKEQEKYIEIQEDKREKQKVLVSDAKDALYEIFQKRLEIIFNYFIENKLIEKTIAYNWVFPSGKDFYKYVYLNYLKDNKFVCKYMTGTKVVDNFFRAYPHFTYYIFDDKKLLHILATYKSNVIFLKNEKINKAKKKKELKNNILKNLKLSKEEKKLIGLK